MSLKVLSFTIVYVILAGAALASDQPKGQWNKLARCVDGHATTLVNVRRPTVSELASAVRSLCRLEIEEWCLSAGANKEYVAGCYASPLVADHIIQRLVLLEGQIQTSR